MRSWSAGFDHKDTQLAGMLLLNALVSEKEGLNLNKLEISAVLGRETYAWKKALINSIEGLIKGSHL